MQHVLRCWERQYDGSEYKKTLWRPELRPGPRWGSLQRSRKPPSWWGGADYVPSPRTPSHRSRPFRLRLSYPHSKISSEAVWGLDPLEICRRGQCMFWPPKMSHSFIQNRCRISLQISRQEWKTCVKMEGKTIFFEAPETVWWLIDLTNDPHPHFYDISTPLVESQPNGSRMTVKLKKN